ncbi:hypothetical protein C8Q74DRAFT_1305710 [Fomes fomentarius]|nr:hypothetical protein C8Q74DRAFT_1305710 [Fomes fomentarius]
MIDGLSCEPAWTGTSVRTLVRDCGCTNFIHTLNSFLRTAARGHSLPLPVQNIHSGTCFAAYKRMQVTLPPLRQVSHHPVKDVIRAVPAQAARQLISASPAHFDTVLARQTPGPVDPDEPLSGLCVARVRAIFQIPVTYGIRIKHPVAYVEWFTPFHTIDANTGMYRISHSTRNHRRHVSIIPITQIVRSIHLIPVWGKSVDCTWTSHNVLDKCRRFLVNP